jgi:membrane-associated phospholipid phosphatase
VAFDPVAGVVFIVAAVLIAVGRVLIGAHYPGDIGASLLVAVASAFFVVRFGRSTIAVLVRFVERATDPVLRPLWRR